MKKLDQRGAVSLISVVIFIIIITVVVMAYLTSALTAQRSSVNFDMGTRAYYSAESGIQDTLRAWSTNPISKQDCTPFIGGLTGQLGSGDYGLDYTCQLIDTEPSSITGEVKPQELTAMVKLNPKTPGAVKKLRIKWSLSQIKTGDSSIPSTLVPRDNGSQDFPTLGDWSDQKFNAMIRLNLIKYAGGSASERVVFLNPATSSNDNLTLNASSEPTQEKTVSNASCAQSGSLVGNNNEFLCEKTLTLDNYNFAGDSIYARIGALYRSTNFSLELLDDKDDPVPLTNAQVTIDVTGRAKNVYRRIKQAFSLNGGYVEDNQPDAALISAEGICKQFSITNNPSDYKEFCDPLN